MISGAHAIIYSTDADADRAFLKDVIGLPSIDSGGGWLIVADVKAFVARMKSHKIKCSELHTERWGVITNVTLPGGGTIGVYQPLHAQPPAAK